MEEKSPWVTGFLIGDTDRKGRFGVRVVSLIAAQAGWSATETPPGEDYKGIDLALDHDLGTIKVQVKCGTRTPTSDGTYSVSITPATLAKLKKQAARGELIYVVYVGVTDPPSSWASHDAKSLRVKAKAHWVRFDHKMSGSTVGVPVDNVLTADTLGEWYAVWDAEAGYVA